jgi:N-methylhydantoinase A/oxoprolinase/acetone carboxylase beta subunit
MKDLERRIDPLVTRAKRELGREGFSGRRVALERQVDARYVGQSYEITLPLSPAYQREFHRQHARMYGYSNPDRPMEVVAVRVKAAGLTDKPTLPFEKPKRAWRPRPARTGSGRFGGTQVRVSFYRWPDLGPGAESAGPAVVTGAEATAVVPPGCAFRIDGYGNVLIHLRAARYGA